VLSASIVRIIQGRSPIRGQASVKRSVIGSVGFQLGGEATDLVLLVMNTRGVDALLTTKVKLGADLSAAAGPKGRDVAASTDASLRSEILSDSRSRGLFAGASVEGTSLRPDNDASREVYGRKMTAQNIVRGAPIVVPESGRQLIAVLEKNAPRNLSKKASQ
jgi:lipid-binding SYLF domain-containing protein